MITLYRVEMTDGDTLRAAGYDTSIEGHAAKVLLSSSSSTNAWETLLVELDSTSSTDLLKHFSSAVYPKSK